ncbi:hypothetical protein V8B97DRAFT_1481029 [Scleroderma yunnanense]
MANNPNKGNPAGNPQMVNALQKVTTGLGELQNRLEPIEAHIGANTVTDHAKMLQTHLTPINTHIDTLQTQVLQGIDHHSVEMIREEVMAVGGAQTRLAAETRVREAQRFNAGCGSGLTRQFEIVPFISDDTAHFPGIYGLPLLHDVHAINRLNNDQLQQYLTRYHIDHDGLGREARLHRLRAHIGCTDDGSASHISTAMIMLLLGVGIYFFRPDMVV